MDWMGLIVDRNKVLSTVNTNVQYLRVPYNARDFLNS